MAPKKGSIQRWQSMTVRDGNCSLKLKKKLLSKAQIRRSVDKAIKKRVHPILCELRSIRILLENSVCPLNHENLPSSYRSSVNQAESSFGSRTFQLHFDCKLPGEMYSSSSIKAEGFQRPLPVKITLLDESKNIVEEGHLSSIKVKIVALGADFMVENLNDWTEEEFNEKIVHRNSKGAPLLAGTLDITLRDGVGLVDDLCFTDNSSFLLNKRVRLAAKVADEVLVDARIKEAVSAPIWVKDSRGKSKMKHPVPSLDDNVRRLMKIGEKYSKMLADQGIQKVKDFLQHYHIDESSLRDILGGVSDTTWESITQHARLCTLNSEHYKYYNNEKGISLLFDCVYDLVGVSFDCKKYQSPETLDECQKNQVEAWRHRALKNLNELVMIDTYPADLSDETVSSCTAIPILSPEDVGVPSTEQAIPILSPEDVGVPSTKQDEQPGSILSTYLRNRSPEHHHSRHQSETEEPNWNPNMISPIRSPVFWPPPPSPPLLLTRSPSPVIFCFVSDDSLPEAGLGFSFK